MTARRATIFPYVFLLNGTPFWLVLKAAKKKPTILGGPLKKGRATRVNFDRGQDRAASSLEPPSGTRVMVWNSFPGSPVPRFRLIEVSFESSTATGCPFSHGNVLVCAHVPYVFRPSPGKHRGRITVRAATRVASPPTSPPRPPTRRARLAGFGFNRSCFFFGGSTTCMTNI